METSKKKIAYLVSLFPCWSETFILNEILELKKQGYPISILSIRSDLEDHIHANAKPLMEVTTYVKGMGMMMSTLKYTLFKPQVIIPTIFKMVFSRYPSMNVRLKDIWSVFTGCYFADICKQQQIEHVHAHFATYPATVAMIMKRVAGIPYTFTTHAHDIFLYQTFLKDKINHSEKIITISEYNRRFLTDKCGESIANKIEVVHCGIDLANWNQPNDGSSRSEHIILSVGRLTRMKGFEHLIRACALLKDKLNFKCHLIGDGHLRAELELLVKELGLSKQFILEGVKDSEEVKAMLERTSVFVMPSIWDDEDGQDGIPLVLMEAMAMQIPSVATRLSGLPELVIHEKTGLIAEPGDNEGLATAIERLLNDRELAQKLGTAGRTIVQEEFNIQKNASLLKQYF